MRIRIRNGKMAWQRATWGRKIINGKKENVMSVF